MPTTRRPSSHDERAALAARRLQAAELVARGRSQAEVASELGVSRQSAHVWHAAWQQGGVDAVGSRGPTGPDPKLSAAQLATVDQALLQGARANGFDTDLWTWSGWRWSSPSSPGPLSPGHVWVILRRRLGWTRQRPQRRASERDEQAIQRWVAQEGPQINKGAAAASAWLVVFDESAVSLIPPVRRTWSPRGRTPVLGHRFGWKKASMAAALGDHVDGDAAWLCFHLQQPSYTTDTGIGVLEQLAGCYADHRVVLLWDGLSAHWSAKLRAWLDRQHDWLRAERLPASAPELNPVEGLWANLKDVELANRPTTTLAEVAEVTEQGVQRVGKREDLVGGFLVHTGLSWTHEPSTQPTKLNKGLERPLTFVRRWDQPTWE